jgi:hypothetical protein
VHRTVWCARRVQGEPTALRTRRRRTTIIHRTVRWCTGLSGGAPDCPVSQRSTAQRSVAKSAGDAWPAPTVGRVHRTVRCAPDSVQCANRRRGATVVCAKLGRRSAPDMLQGLSGGAPDCPVCHRTVSGAPGWINSNSPPSGFWKSHSAIIHRTVWCDTKLSDVPAEQRLPSATVDFNGRLTGAQCADSARRVRAGARRHTGQ